MSGALAENTPVFWGPGGLGAGNFQEQLERVLNDVPVVVMHCSETPHKEFLDAGRSGMHHLSFHVPDLDAVVERSRGLGYEPVWYHRMSEEIAYTYLERPGDPLYV